MFEIIVPKIEANTEEVTFVKWLKNEDEYVKKGEALFLIETIKAIIEIEAEEEGYLRKTLVNEGDEVKVLDVVAYLGEENETILEEPIQKHDKIKLSPAAKRLVKKYNINVDEVFKNHKKVVKEQDILKILNGNKEKIPYHSEKISSKKKTEIKNIQNNCVIPISSVTSTFSSEKMNKKVEKISTQHKLRINNTEYIAHAAAKILKNFSKLNSYFTEDEIRFYDEINIGMAMEIDEYLYAPVIHNANELTLMDFSNRTKELSLRLLSGKIKPSELSGGTFTISDLSSYDVTNFNPLINADQTAILGICSEYDTLTLNNNKVKNEKKQKLVLTFDHRVVTGKYAAQFLMELKKELEL